MPDPNDPFSSALIGSDDPFETARTDLPIPKSEGFLQKAMGIGRSLVGPQYQAAGHFANTAAFGLPGIAMDKMLPQETKDYLKPQGVGEHVGAMAGDIGGFMMGGPEQLAAKGAARFLPKGAGFLSRLGRGAGKGAAAMGSIEAPQVLAGNEDPMSAVGKTALGAGLQGGFEGVAPVAMGAAKKVGGFVKNAPKRFGEIWNSPQRSEKVGAEIADVTGQIARDKAAASSPDFSRQGERIAGQAYKNVKSEFESNITKLKEKSRNIFAEHAPEAKKRMKDTTNKVYSTYDDILKKGEAEFEASGATGDDYRNDVIEPVLEMIEKTGARTPAAQKLLSLFRAKGGSDAAYEAADKVVQSNFDNLTSIEKMKALRTSLYKEGSEDFVQSAFSDAHQKFVGKYSPSVAEANKSYGPMKQALRWGSKNFKPFNEHEVKKVADIVEKSHAGQLDETTASYLKTLREGRGQFKGQDLTKLGKTHQAVMDSLEKEIQQSQRTLSNLESQHLSDVGSIRRGSMESTLGKQNILEESAKRETHMQTLKNLKEKIDQDVRTKKNLEMFAWISGLATIGVGRGVYSLARAMHPGSDN